MTRPGSEPWSSGPLVIMMLYKNTKAIVRLPDDGTDFFDIVFGMLTIKLGYIP